MNRTDRGRPIPRPPCDTMPTPGVAPREELGTRTSGGVPWTRGVSHSRRASRTFHRSAASTALALDAGLEALDLRLEPDARAGAIDGHARLLLAWTGSINLTGIRDPARGRTAHMRRQPERGRRPARRAASIGSSTSAPVAATRACRSAARSRPSDVLLSNRSARRPDSSRRSSRRSGVGDRRGGRRPGRDAGRRPGSSRALAGGHGPCRRDSRRPRRAGLPAAGARRRSWSPGNAAISWPRWPPRQRAIDRPRWRHADGRPVARARSRGPRPGRRRPVAAGCPTRYPRDPRRAGDAPW